MKPRTESPPGRPEPRGGAETRSGKLPYLDGLRAFAILIVMGFHSGVGWVRNGYLGVDVFFVLSGFLITYLIVEEHRRTGKVSLGNFHLRRALRLFPALLAVLLFCCLYAITFAHEGEGAAMLKASLFALLYSTNWVLAFHLASLNLVTHTWALGVEVQFYLLWPPILLFLLAKGVGRGKLLAGVLCVAALAAAERAWLWLGGASIERCYAGLDVRADSLLIGCAVGLLAAWGILPRSRWATLAVRAGALAGAALYLFLVHTRAVGWGFFLPGGFTLVDALLGLVIVALLTTRSRALQFILESPIVAWVGSISYGLYLWHFPIRKIVSWHCHWPRILKIPFEDGLSIAAAWLSHRFVERPFLNLKVRFSSARGAIPRPPAS